MLIYDTTCQLGAMYAVDDFVLVDNMADASWLLGL